MVQSLRRCRIAAVALLAVTGVACGSDDPVTTPTPTPTAITETFEGTLTVNGAATYPFVVVQAGLASAVLTTILPDTATVGVSLGTWNGQGCQIILANDSATQNVAVVGEARSAGNFCVRIHDVGKLTAPANYLLTVTHY